MAEAQDEKKKPAKKAAKPEGGEAAAKPKAAKPAGEAKAKAAKPAAPAVDAAAVAAEKAARKADKKAAKKARAGARRVARPQPVRHARPPAPKAAPQPKTGKTVTVIQIGSPIGRETYQRATLKGLGLDKLRRTRTLEDTPAVRGMIDRVRHLVRVVAG